MKWVVPCLLLLLFCFTGCIKIQEPEFRSIRGIRLKNMGLEEATIGLIITYFNPNNFSVAAKETAIDIYLDSTYLGRFIQDSVVEVNQRADFSIPLTGKISLTTFLNLNLNDIHKREIFIQAEGSTKVGIAGFYLTQKIHFVGRHRLSALIWTQKNPPKRE